MFVFIADVLLALILTFVDTIRHRNRKFSEIKDDAFAQFWDWINRKSNHEFCVPGEEKDFSPFVVMSNQKLSSFFQEC